MTTTLYFEKILIVEDDPMFQIVMAEYFLRKNQGLAKIEMADSGLGALRHLKAGPFDLVLLDHHLKGTMNGLQLCREIESQYPNLAIIMISGIPQDEFTMRARKHPRAPQFLPKPFSAAKLEAVLQIICASRISVAKAA